MMASRASQASKSAAALAVFYGVYRFALKNDTHFQTGRLYLLASLLAAHLVPLFHITSPFRQMIVPAGAPGDVDVAAAAAGGWNWQQAPPQGASRIPRRPGSPCARLRPVHQ
jgi:hypothetical protein